MPGPSPAAARPFRINGPAGYARPTLCPQPMFKKSGPRQSLELAQTLKGVLPTSLSRGTEGSVPCITCHAPRKRGSSHCVLHLFGIEYHLTALKTDGVSSFTLPGTAGAFRFAKADQHKLRCHTGQIHAHHCRPHSGMTRQPPRCTLAALSRMHAKWMHHATFAKPTLRLSARPR